MDNEPQINQGTNPPSEDEIGRALAAAYRLLIELADEAERRKERAAAAAHAAPLNPTTEPLHSTETESNHE